MDPRKTQLSEFLRSCRGRLSPSRVGLPERRRRRTPGLRREDVAALAGVSVTWYTWLEQGIMTACPEGSPDAKMSTESVAEPAETVS